MGRRPDPKPQPYKAKNGRVTWFVRVRHHNKQTSETFETKAEAQTFCDDVRNRGVDEAIRLREAALTPPTTPAGATTLDAVFDDFLTWKKPRIRTERTIEEYRSRYDHSIRDTLGRLPIADIQPKHIQAWVDDLVTGVGRTQPLATKSIADRHGLLHSVMEYAAHPNRALIAANPCKSTELPKRRMGQPKGLRPAEWRALHIALQQIDPDAADLAYFLVSTGWRFGEAVALTTYDVEDDGDHMWVTVTRVARRETHGIVRVVEDAKSDAALRRIELDPEAADEVRRRVRTATPGGFVFTTKNGAMWRHGHFRSRAWLPAVEAANLTRNPTPHWLRHTHVFWQTTTGQTTLQEVGRRIGHKQIGTTMNVYGRMVGDVRPEALSAFARVRDGAPTTALEAGAVVAGEVVKD